MARLLGEDDEQFSYLDIQAAGIENLRGQSWQRFSLSLVIGKLTLAIPPSGGTEIHETDCLFCRSPQDELSTLVSKLELFLQSSKDSVLFEPSEPSFEMTISRTQAAGAKIEVWLDSGNAAQGIYRWDAVGARFQTTEKHIATFLSQLKQEFAC